MSADASGPDTCGACQGIAPQTPATVSNRAGLAAIAYRVGTHASFNASMQARLGALPGLRTRDPGDFTLGLLDAWASAADVLSFYQERIANESYLRTAVERRSLARLGELIGYAPQPGVAASTWLAFTLLPAPGTTDDAPTQTIPAGTAVQSIPAPGALPQTFETIESIRASADWNLLRPSLTKPQPVTASTDALLVEGLSTALKPGDALVVVPSDEGSRPMLRSVAGVSAVPARQQTWVTLRPLGGGVAAPPPPPSPRPPLRALALDRVAIAEVPLHLPTTLARAADWSIVTQVATAPHGGFVAPAADLATFGWRFKLPVRRLFRSLAAWSVPVQPSAYALRSRASLFGWNAPDPRSLSDSVGARYSGDIDGGDWKRPDDLRNPLLDAAYPRIAAGSADAPSFAALKWSDGNGAHWVVAEVVAAGEVGYARYTLSGKVTQLQLSPVGQSDAGAATLDLGSFANLRGASVLAESEALTLAALPRSDEPLAAGSEIELDGWVDGLYAGQRLVVTGELDLSRGTVASEMVQIQSVDQIVAAGGGTLLTLANALTRSYVRDTVTISANVAAATHGSAVQEVMGSGDATQPGQRFALRQAPLTYVGASTPSGVASTLALRVNGLLWRETPDFYACGPTDRVYTVQQADDGTTAVSFGDGVNGARPSTGTENIVAAYRKGIGSVGNLAAGQLSLMQTRPLGVQSVNNPIAASGGTDPESADDIRANAALTLRTLGRIVSLQDYEDFARAFGGIAKSLAVWTGLGQTRGVFLTVAGVDGADVDPGSALHAHLLAAIAAAAEPGTPVALSSYRRAAFTFAASLVVDPARELAAVLGAAEQAARAAYAFERRAFGQPVSRSEIIALLQGVPGVVAVQVSALRRTDTALFVAARAATLRENAQLNAALPAPGDGGSVLAAELLTLDPRPLDLTGAMHAA